MNGFKENIEKLTLENDNFRRVVYTGKHSQLVLMSLRPNEEIGLEVHADTDQFFRFEKGVGRVVIDGLERTVEGGDAFLVPAGSQHNIINASGADVLQLYTIYSPPHHRDGVIHKTKADAESSKEEFDGKTTE